MFGRPPDPLNQFSARVQRAFEQQNTRINDLQKQSNILAQRLAAQHSTSEADETMEELKRREEHYTQVVMLAGYAGFFTLWVQTRSEMSLWMFASTGALISISLITFVGFELYKSWRTGCFFSSKVQHYAQEVNTEVSKINKHWHLAFIISSGTGVLAGVSLLLWFVYMTVVAAARMAGAA